MSNKPLPIGIRTFRDIVARGYLYVDKTEWIYELIRYPKGVYFLSRPRRFGKSLLISTLASIFQGERELFAGLWLDGTAVAALQQIKERAYFAAYQETGKPLTLIEANFATDTRQVSEWQVEVVTS